MKLCLMYECYFVVCFFLEFVVFDLQEVVRLVNDSLECNQQIIDCIC